MPSPSCVGAFVRKYVINSDACDIDICLVFTPNILGGALKGGCAYTPHTSPPWLRAWISEQLLLLLFFWGGGGVGGMWESKQLLLKNNTNWHSFFTKLQISTFVSHENIDFAICKYHISLESWPARPMANTLTFSFVWWKATPSRYIMIIIQIQRGARDTPPPPRRGP